MLGANVLRHKWRGIAVVLTLNYSILRSTYHGLSIMYDALQCNPRA